MPIKPHLKYFTIFNSLLGLLSFTLPLLSLNILHRKLPGANQVSLYQLL